jgi:hypothetical protein
MDAVPTMSASLPIRITTATTDPPITLNTVGIGLQLKTQNAQGSVSCNPDSQTTLTPAMVGPISPGASQVVAFSVASHGGTCATELCGFCGASVVYMNLSFNVVQGDGRYPQTEGSIPVFYPPANAPTQVSCGP